MCQVAVATSTSRSGRPVAGEGCRPPVGAGGSRIDWTQITDFSGFGPYQAGTRDLVKSAVWAGGQLTITANTAGTAADGYDEVSHFNEELEAVLDGFDPTAERAHIHFDVDSFASWSANLFFCLLIGDNSGVFVGIGAGKLSGQARVGSVQQSFGGYGAYGSTLAWVQAQIGFSGADFCPSDLWISGDDGPRAIENLEQANADRTDTPLHLRIGIGSFGAVAEDDTIAISNLRIGRSPIPTPP